MPYSSCKVKVRLQSARIKNFPTVWTHFRQLLIPDIWLQICRFFRLSPLLITHALPSTLDLLSLDSDLTLRAFSLQPNSPILPYLLTYALPPLFPITYNPFPIHHTLQCVPNDIKARHPIKVFGISSDQWSVSGACGCRNPQVRVVGGLTFPSHLHP